MSVDSSAIKFLGAALLSAVALMVTVWFADLRVVVQSSLIGFAVVAFLPFIVIAVCLMFFLVAALVGAFLAIIGGDGFDANIETGVDAAEGVVAGTGWVARYYRWLARQQQPALLGAFSGLALSTLMLWAFLAVFVIPKETETLQRLAEAQAEVERIQKRTGTYPEAIQNRLMIGDAPALDAFGRALEYNVKGSRLIGSFTLRAYGYDGRKSADDLCVGGATKLAQLTAKARDAALYIRRFTKPDRARDPSVTELWAALDVLRCDAP